jgi:hypothetical protein
MGRQIIPTNHPSIRQIAIQGELNYEDMTCEADLDLDKGVPIWVILDVASMSVTLPEHFLDGARQSFFMNPNLQHMAIYCQSAFLRTLALMVAKLTRRKEKLSVHDSLEKAEAHIRKLLQ